MSVSKEDRMADHRLPLVVACMCALIAGLAGLNRMMQSPQFESYRTVDVIALTGSGVCFGATMVGMAIAILRPRFLKHHQNRAIRQTDQADNG